jgi:hypothetical protein
MVTAPLIGHIQALGVTLLILFGAWSWGSLFVRRWGMDLTVLERTTHHLVLGLGIVGLSIFGMGILGLLSVGGIVVALAIPCVVNSLVMVWRRPSKGSPTAPLGVGVEVGSSRWSVAGLIVLGAIGLITLVMALAPPSRYDALMYHLVGPQTFLEQGQVFASTTRWWINFPATVEMLYIVSLALGSETGPALIHVAFLGLYMLSAYSVARHIGGASVGGLAVILLAGMPILALWASGPEVDFGWAAFELESSACLMAYLEGRKGPWLLLSGVFAGMALGTKYLAALGFLAILALLLYETLRKEPRRVLSAMAGFIVPAMVAALPWYAKNLITLGDPIFPFLIGSRLDPARMQSFTWYATSLHGARGFLDWLALPIAVFLQPERFSATAPLQSSPNPLFLLVPLAALAAPSRSITRIAAFAGLRYLFWSITPALSVRYLLPAFPWMAIIVASALVTVNPTRLTSRVFWRVVQALPAVILIYSLVIVMGIALSMNPFKVVLGAETREAFLRRSIPTFPAMEYADRIVGPGDRVLTTGDGRAYYFPSLIVDSDDQFLWLQFVEDSSSAEAFAQRMKALPAAYLLVSRPDVDFFASLDTTGRISSAIHKLESDILPRCGTLLYEDGAASLFRIGCQVEGG